MKQITMDGNVTNIVSVLCMRSESESVLRFHRVGVSLR